MTVAEKRSVLASWASDACAIESNPTLRASATGNVVSYDDIIDALQSLDAGESADTVIYAFKRRQRRRRWSDWKGRRRCGPDNGEWAPARSAERLWMGGEGSRAVFRRPSDYLVAAPIGIPHSAPPSPARMAIMQTAVFRPDRDRTARCACCLQPVEASAGPGSVW